VAPPKPPQQVTIDLVKIAGETARGCFDHFLITGSSAVLQAVVVGMDPVSFSWEASGATIATSGPPWYKPENHSQAVTVHVIPGSTTVSLSVTIEIAHGCLIKATLALPVYSAPLAGAVVAFCELVHTIWEYLPPPFPPAPEPDWEAFTSAIEQSQEARGELGRVAQDLAGALRDLIPEP